MRKPLVTLTLFALAIVLLAVWFATRSSDGLQDSSAAADASRLPPDWIAAPAVEPLEIAAPQPSAPSRSSVEVVDAAPQEIEPESPALGEVLAELRGRFLLPDGRPASGVALRVNGWEGNSELVMKHGLPLDWIDPETTTDADGRFTFRFDPPLAFQFTLNAALAGHANLSWRWDSLPPREVTDIGEVALIRSGVVRGRVVDARGVAAPGAWRVYGETARTHLDEGRGATGTSASTDPVTAEFLLEGLPPGPAKLKLYSRIANWIDGPRVEVRAGQEVTADVVYDGPDNSRRIVLGTFHNPFHVFSNPVSGSIVLHGAGEKRIAKRIAGSSQSWSFEDLEPGAYDIEIRDPLFEPWRQNGVRTGTPVDAHLRANGAVQLTVVGVDRSLVEDYRLRISFPQDAATPDGTNFSFSPNEFELRAAGEPRPNGGIFRGMIPAGIAMDSGFEGLEGFAKPAFQRTSPRAFVLHVDAPGHGTGQARVEGLNVGETRLVIVQLTSTAAIVGRITGVSADLLEGVSIVLADERVGVDGATEFVEGITGMSEDLYFRAETRTDRDGGFSFGRLHAGAYVLVARFHHEFTVARSSAILQPGETLELELDAGSYGAIEGRILAPSNDLENAWVEALGVGHHDPFAGGWSIFDGEPPPRARVDADGRFRIAPLHTRTYELTLHHSSRELPKDRKRWASRFAGGARLGAVPLLAHEVAYAEFDLSQQRRGTIHVRTQVDGEPAFGWRVHAKPATSESAPRTTSTSTLVGSDGVAHLELLEPGTWSVGVVANEDGWSSWAATPVELAPGAVREVQLDVVRHAGRVRVLRAADGEPRARSRVRWVHEHGETQLTTDSHGMLELRLPVGTYFATANGNSVTIEWTAAGPVPPEIKL
jgi:hypothetical protein